MGLVDGRLHQRGEVSGLEGRFERPDRQVGLDRRGRADASGASEARYLAPLEAIAESGATLADILLERYAGPWAGDVRHAYRDFAF